MTEQPNLKRNIFVKNKLISKTQIQYDFLFDKL